MSPDRCWAGNEYPQPPGFAANPDADQGTSPDRRFLELRPLSLDCSGAVAPEAVALLPRSRLPNSAHPLAWAKARNPEFPFSNPHSPKILRRRFCRGKRTPARPFGVAIAFGFVPSDDFGFISCLQPVSPLTSVPAGRLLGSSMALSAVLLAVCQRQRSNILSMPPNNLRPKCPSARSTQ